ncbi:hypothetical protein INT45_011554 [Circinella minor]|uniref:Uncharacterized protein n=1 Tax=Circinella minor TaxID=1195481 RepID=A0A8H7VNQ9_9FUNG|nr:hypothetical protein INT45_011554 [Circinella minor]
MEQGEPRANNKARISSSNQTSTDQDDARYSQSSTCNEDDFRTQPCLTSAEVEMEIGLMDEYVEHNLRAVIVLVGYLPDDMHNTIMKNVYSSQENDANTSDSDSYSISNNRNDMDSNSESSSSGSSDGSSDSDNSNANTEDSSCESSSSHSSNLRDSGDSSDDQSSGYEYRRKNKRQFKANGKSKRQNAKRKEGSNKGSKTKKGTSKKTYKRSSCHRPSSNAESAKRQRW